jgi:CheY-like chemotaxis protein
MAPPVILLVDDEPDLLQILTDVVARAAPHHRVVGATTLAEAQGCLDDLERTGTPLAVALVDHMLGGPSRSVDAGTGLDLIETVQRRFPTTPTFLFTGQASPGVAERARASGARVLWKPVKLSALVGEVTGALG